MQIHSNQGWVRAALADAHHPEAELDNRKDTVDNEVALCMNVRSERCHTEHGKRNGAKRWPTTRRRTPHEGKNTTKRMKAKKKTS